MSKCNRLFVLCGDEEHLGRHPKVTGNDIWVLHPVKLAVVVSIAKLTLRCYTVLENIHCYQSFLVLDAHVVWCLKCFWVLNLAHIAPSASLLILVSCFSSRGSCPAAETPARFTATEGRHSSTTLEPCFRHSFLIFLTVLDHVE